MIVILIKKGENMVIYETERLIIRNWENKDSDIDDLYEIGSDKITNRYLTYPLYEKRDTAIERIKYLLDTYEKGYINEDQDYAIELKETGKVIGSIAIMGYKACADGVVELGYQLNSKYFNNGYMSETVKGMIKYIFANGIASRIQAKHDTNNMASGKVMQKSGMSFEGVLRKYSSNNSARRVDCMMYSILKEEV